jgi:formate--tetrahydrofolate ligase
MTKDLLPIEAIVEKLNLPEKYVERLGRYGAKLTLDLLDDPAFPVRGKFILVTATTPTLSGEGKTVTSIGLVQGLEKIGKKAIITSREPSLGPVFGMKGGAAGGGRSQVEPAEKINLHFHGDFHAITSAHNLLAALIDSHLFHGNELDLDPNAITWPRTLDMNDRALRNIIVQAGGKRDGANRHTGFLITAASEIMAIMTLAASREDLRKRLARIVIGQTRSGKPVLADDLKATGPMTPALVHCGPFANIAHGTSSVLSQQMGLRLADYVVNETGFASDLGLEKYMDIVMPSSGIKPSAAVLVTTVQSVRNQGEGDLEAGFENLKKHIAIVRSFNLPAIVAINRFPNDTDEELKFLERYCEAQGAAFALSEAFAKGGAGAAALAEKVVSVIAANPQVAPTSTYSPSASPQEKITAVAQKVYGAAKVELTPQAEEKLARFTKWGYGELPVCIAKTQYSLTDDPKLMGAPTGWTLHISDVVLSAGAGFLVVISGSMMLMPGLPKSSRAMGINVDAAGEITGMS